MKGEQSVTICLAVEGHPVPPVLSVKRWCSLCACEIWVGEIAQEREATEGTTFVCTACGVGSMEATGGQLVMDDKTKRQLRKLGYSNEEIQRMYLRALREIGGEQ